MKNIIIAFILLIPLRTFAQDTLYFDSFLDKVNNIQSCEYYKLLKRDENDTNKVCVKSYLKTGELIEEINYSNYSKNIKNGYSKKWYKNGQLKLDSYYLDNKLINKLLTFWSKGQPKRIDNYIEGKFINGEVFDSLGAKSAYYELDVSATFPGGFSSFSYFIAHSINYPEYEMKNGIKGIVHVSFIIDIEGNIKNVKLIKGISKGLDEEAIRVIKKSPKWEPAFFDGEAKQQKFILPVKFNLK